MKVIIVTQDDPFYLPIFFREFFALIRDAENIQIEGVIVQRSLGNKNRRGLARRMVNLYGPIGFTRIGARYAFTKVRNALAEAGLLREGFSIRWYCEQAGVAILPYSDVNAAETVAFIRRTADLVVSVAASQIFRKPVLEAPRLGCINLHNAPLPKYRGMLPNFWQMYHGETHSVLTIHQMVEELDKGDILLQQATEIEPDMSLDQLIRRTKARSAAVLMDVLHGMRDGTIETTPLPDEPGSYFSFPGRSDAKEFRARGRKLL